MNALITTNTTLIPTISSREIAELTGKLHKNVCADIRRIFEECEIDALRFQLVYKGNNGQDRPYYALPRRECDLIMTSYSAKYRLKIIDRWIELEAKEVNSTPRTFVEAMKVATQALIDAEQKQLQIENLNEVIKKDEPKVKFAEMVADSEDCCTIEEFAKAIGVSRNKLFEWLRNEYYLCRKGKYNLPYQEYLKKEWFKVNEYTFVDYYGEPRIGYQTLITTLGQIKISRIFRQEEYK